MKTRRRIGIAIVTGALVVLAAAPASATETGWFWSNGLYPNNGTYSNALIGTGSVTGEEYGGGYPGDIYARTLWTPNGINYYWGIKEHGAYRAVSYGTQSVAIKLDHD